MNPQDSLRQQLIPLWAWMRDVQRVDWDAIYSDPRMNPNQEFTRKSIQRGVEDLRARSKHEQDDTPTEVIDAETDQVRWLKSVNKLPEITRLAYVSDMHIPDHDQRAIDLAVQLVADYNPHILIHGSDAFDFPTVSTFDVDPNDILHDVLEKVGKPYRKNMRALNDAAPNAATPFLVGNHDYRIWRWLTKKAIQVRGTVTRDFISLVRDAGGLWLGFDFIEFEVGTLKVIHGKRATKYAASDNLSDFGGDIISGHVHRAMTYARTFDREVRISMTTGCLQNLRPSYSQWPQAWQHGIGFVTIDQKQGLNHFENLIFQDYQVAWGGKVYRA